MHYSPILAPVVALVAWTLVVMFWMLRRALRASFAASGLPSTNIPDGARGVDLDGKAEARQAQWKSHNYNHLMEQPTIFYAIALTLALMDFGGGINYWLAWGYVGLRDRPQPDPMHGQYRPLSASPCSPWRRSV